MEKRILLMYISLNSGHHRASQGIEKAIRQLSPDAELRNVNALHYTHPFLEPLIRQGYFSLLRHYPKAWDALYDHPAVFRRTAGLVRLLYRLDSRKFKTLLEEFQPGVVVCTQAFPCGMVSDYKKSFGLALPLVGVLTDYQAHAYWVHSEVDYYVVATQEAEERLREKGVSDKKILSYGIPVDPAFSSLKNREEILRKHSLSPEVPTLLIMGGSYGFGPIAEFVEAFDRSGIKAQLLVVCGKNERLFNRLSRKAILFKKRVRVLGFVDCIDELMEAATCLITKPGGITTAEAVVKGLPMVLLNPIGGQETTNTEFLLKKGFARKAKDVREALELVRGLLEEPSRLEGIRQAARRHPQSTSAFELAQRLLSLC